MIKTIGRTINQEIITDFPIEYIERNELEWYWIDIGEPTKEEEQLLSSFFHFHPLAIEDCLQMLQRPKLDHYEEYEFLVLHSFNEKEMEAEELNLFISKNFVVSFHFPPMLELQEARDRIKNNPKEWERSTILITYYIVDKVVDTYFPIVYHIEDYLNEVDERLSMDMDHLSMDQVFDLRSDLLRLRRTIIPMRDLLYRVMYSERINLNQSERAYFDDIYDHLLKLAEMVEANRELTADIRDSYDSINASRMNRIMMILTTVSTVFIPLTFIVGIYGMNFKHMPELEWKFGYFTVVVLMIVIAGGMIAWFKYKGWFKLFRS